jgi:hypothetical protein
MSPRWRPLPPEARNPERLGGFNYLGQEYCQVFCQVAAIKYLILMELDRENI